MTRLTVGDTVKARRFIVGQDRTSLTTRMYTSQLETWARLRADLALSLVGRECSTKCGSPLATSP